MLSKLQMRALENECYVLGAAAFSVFVRWLQIAAGTDDNGLFNKTVWNYLVPVLIIISFCIFYGMTRKLKKDRYYLDEEISSALSNSGKLFKAIRIIIGAVMIAGAGLLFATCETDREATLLRILSILGILTGASFIWITGEYNKSKPNIDMMCVASVAPILLFALWLITAYKANDINSIVWAYAIEILACCFAMFAFFRVAGFSFGSVDFKKVLNATMCGTYMLILALADTRNLGQQAMLISAILMLVYYDWLLITNFRQKEAPMSYQPRDGFERL